MNLIKHLFLLLKFESDENVLCLILDTINIVTASFCSDQYYSDVIISWVVDN